MWYGPSRLLWNAIRFPSGLSTGRRFAACVVVSCRIGEAERLEYPASSTTHAARMSARMLVRRLTSARRRATADRAHALPGQDRRQDRHDHTTKQERDRKSTRLNSSHITISYAVFCLKKKKKKKKE